MLRTRFTERFGLAHPVMSAPMTLHTGPALTAAVSEAGGMGSFGGINRWVDPRWVHEQAAQVRARTERPFAIGFITPFIPLVEPMFDAALEVRPALIALSFGGPAPWISRCHQAGVEVVCQVQTTAQADAAVEAGADLLVAQGTEAGGHTGRLPMLPFLTEVLARHPSLPVLAAGGIGDGRTLASAIAAGADGAWVGTAFLATDEVTEIDQEHKDLIVQSDGTDTVVTRAYDIVSRSPWPPDSLQRVRRNAFTDEWEGREAELEQVRERVASELAASTSLDTREVMYGVSAALVSQVRPAAEVLQTMCEDAERYLAG